MRTTEVNLASIAGKVVNQCLLLKPGERFWISCADNYYYDFAEELAIAAIEAGAHPIITMSSDVLSRKKYDNPIEYLKAPSIFSPPLIHTADAMLILGFPKNPDVLRNVPPEKLAANAIGSRNFTEEVLKRNKDRANLRQSSFLYPTPEAAKKYGFGFEEYSDLIWGAVDIDYPELAKKARKIAAITDPGETVHITNDDGTDLTFSIKGRPTLIDDGVMDEADVESNMYLQNIPTGEVYLAPVEDSANGVAVFQYNIFKGEPLINFRATFKDGVIVGMEAEKGLEHYKNIMDRQSGEKYRIAELGIGLNPAMTKVTGCLALDEKIVGTIHIATGENRMFKGGQSEASIHWDMVMFHPTVEIDGKRIMERGKYTLRKDEGE